MGRVWRIAAAALVSLAVADARADVRETVERQQREDAAEEELRDREAATTARTKTPYDPLCAATNPVPGRFNFWATPGSSRTPYNCLHWGFCRNDAWSQPVPPGTSDPAITLTALMAGEGFDMTTPVDCANGGGNHVVMLVWNVPNSELPVPPAGMPDDEHWKHAMKRLAGKWSSKNGSAGHHSDIQNTSRFLDRHYPTPPGHTRIIRCYSKP